MSPRVRPPADDGEGRVPRLREPRFSQSLERGLEILQCFTPRRPVLGISEIADAVGMSRSTTHRYVITLVELGFLEQTSNRKYRLGLRVLDVGMSAMNSMGLREHAHSFLEELSHRTGYAASVAVLDGTDVVYVDRVASFRRGEHELGLNIRVGSRLPSYCTALGKALIAGLSDDERRELIAGVELKRRAPSTIKSKRALASEIERVAEDGVAVDDEECARGLVAIAVPVRDERGQVSAAVALEAPAQTISLKELADALGPHLAATAGLISGRLGYRRSDEVAR